MASPHTINWTVEFSHSGQKRLMRSDAETEVLARREFARVVRSMNDEDATADYATLKKHPNTDAANKYVADFRKARGLDEAPSEGEMQTIAQGVFSKPPADDESEGSP